MINTKLSPLATLIPFVVLSGCVEEDSWEGFVYPNRNDLTQHVEIGSFETLEQCRSAALNRMSVNGWTNVGDYECGLNCKPWEGTDMKICKETKR